jgi:hypothetical protein
MSTEPITSSSDTAAVPGKAAAYLVACGLPPAKAEECAASFAAHPRPPDTATDPTAEIVDALDDWALTLPTDDEPDLSAEGIARSRARLLLVGLPSCRPGFCHGPLPPGMPAALARANLQVAPDLHQTSMTAQPLDLGALSEVADETWRTFDKWPVLRGLAIWTLFLGLLVAVLVTIRF